MKKYLLGISVCINIILIIALVIAIVMFFNMKNKVMTIVDQVKSGEYIAQVQQNTKQIIPKTLNDLKNMALSDNPCEGFYQKVDAAIEYLNNGQNIIDAQVYEEQLSAVKVAIDKTPTILKEKACKKGISSINYIINTIQPDAP